MENGTSGSTMRIEIAWKTIIKVLLAILLAYVAVKLWPLCELVIVSLLLAVPLHRLVHWVCLKGWPRWTGLLVTSLALVVAVVGFAALVGPMVLNQASNLGKDLPKLKQQLESHLPATLKTPIEQATSTGSNADLQRLGQKALAVIKGALGGVLDLVLVVAITIYLMADGPRAYQWLIAFFPRAQRPRVSKGLEKIGNRVVDYIIGQSIVSGLFAGYVLAVLSILQVPMALLLAVIAGVLDVVPVLGISISLALGALMALTVSSTASLLVVTLYGAYHVLENYLIMPKVYGEKLQLSALAVLLSMLAGGMVAGVVGAIAILPLVAAYPALESLWLGPQLEAEVVKDHQEQLRAA